MEIRDLSFQYGRNLVLKSVSAFIEKGKITTIMGANGCGKSTLFNLMTKNLKPLRGGVYLENTDIQRIGLKDFSRKVAIVHQYNSAPGDITVRELVAYGRTPYFSFYGRKDCEDGEIIDWAMNVTNIYRYRDKPVSTLSGGQKQRVWIAMALAQKTGILLLDEPTAYLDIRYQIQILDLIRMLNRELGITVVMVLHDINQAICYSDEIIGLKDGKVAVRGKADEVITGAVLHDIYGVNLKILETENGKYVLTVSDKQDEAAGL